MVIAFGILGFLIGITIAVFVYRNEFRSKLADSVDPDYDSS